MIFKKHDQFANKKWKGVISEKKKESLLCYQGLVLLDWPWQVRTCPNSDFDPIARIGSKTYLLIKKERYKFCDKRKVCLAGKDLSSPPGPPGLALAGPDISKFRLLVKLCMFRI